MLHVPRGNAFVPGSELRLLKDSPIGTATGDQWTTYVIPAQEGVARQIVPGNDETADATWMPDNKPDRLWPLEKVGNRVASRCWI